MSGRGARTGIALAVIWGLAAAAVAREGFRYHREIAVGEPGWVGVRLEGNALVHAATDLRLFAPDGGEVPYRLLGPAAEASQRPVRVRAVEEEASGWRLVMDLGPEPPGHARLVFELVQRASVAGCRLEGSDDLESWEPLAVGDLFRLGDRPDFQQTAFDYPPSRHRYLRLHWPESAGLPELRRVRAEVLDDRSALRPIEDRACSPPGGGLVCRLPVPEPAELVRRLDLGLAAADSVGLRLRVAEEGRWRLLHEAVVPGDTREIQVPVRLAERSGPLRLEIHAAGEETPELVSAAVWVASRRLIFEAEEAGTYVLAYGRSTPAAASRTEDRTADWVAWVAAGEERADPWPAFRPALVEPGAPMPEASWSHAWELAGDAEPGALVRLEVPPAVHAAARPDLGDLRLEVAGRQLPYVRASQAEPELAGRWEALGPGPPGGARGNRSRSSVEVEVEPGLPLTELYLSSSAAPFERPVWGFFLRPARPGIDEQRLTAFPRNVWRCEDRAPLDCVLAPSLARAEEGGKLVVEIHDGDNPPLPALGLELWRRSEALVFVWPEAEPVVLRAGAADLRAPRYDLGGLGDLLRLRPAAAIELGAGGPRQVAGEWSRWLLPASLVLAGGVLLLLLARMLRRGD